MSASTPLSTRTSARDALSASISSCCASTRSRDMPLA
jgi:hypothetical protein